MANNQRLALRINEIFHDIEGEKYQEKHEDIFTREALRWQKIAKEYFQSSKKPITVLDIGPGIGFIPINTAKYLSENDTFICSDISEKMLTVSKNNIGNENFKCNFKFKKLDGNTVGINTATIITMNSVVHHIPGLDVFFTKIGKIIETGRGIIIGKEPNKLFYTEKNLVNKYLFFKIFSSLKNLAVETFRSLKLNILIKKISKNKTSKKEIVLKENNILIKEKTINKELTENEINKMIDYHSLTAGSKIDKTKGIDIEDLHKKHLPSFEMKIMKINVFFDFIDGPYGGGNQFLKALRNYFIDMDVYSEDVENADVILFNSHHQIKELIKIKRKYPNKIFIHRIDGPIFLIRKDNIYLDKLIYKLNDKIADASIFQSAWSKKRNIELGIKQNKFETTILNAPNPLIFNKKNKTNFNKNKKNKIIATSWASNMSKGFDAYKYLDENLDFSKFEMTFCGNSPFEFKNIKHIKPLPSNELANELKKHDIYITASKNDPCSNSLIEALHCRLPAVGLNDGGHTEIIGEAGIVFNEKNEIIEIINKIVENYNHYQKKINLPTMQEVGNKYYNFIKNVFDKTKKTKNSSIFSTIGIYKLMYYQKIKKHIK